MNAPMNPCRFCGHVEPRVTAWYEDPEVEGDPDVMTSRVVACDNLECSAYGPSRQTIEEAIIAWNTVNPDWKHIAECCLEAAESLYQFWTDGFGSDLEANDKYRMAVAAFKAADGFYDFETPTNNPQ